MYPDPGSLASENSDQMIRLNLFRFLSGKKCSCICPEKTTENSIQMVSAPSLHVPVNLLFGGWPPSCGLHRRRRAYAPTSNTASHDNHEKINSWVSFSFLYEYGAPLGGPWGRRSSAINFTVLTKFCVFWNDGDSFCFVYLELNTSITYLA